MQSEEAHLQCDCLRKTVYHCNADSICYLFQEQQFHDGKLHHDRMYSINMDTIFDLSFDLSQYPRVSLLNERDGRSSEYYFTASDQLRYFVQTENTNRFMVYTYFPNGQLKSVKHCINPLDDHHSCLYYTFTYEHSRIFSTNTYYLKNSIDSVKKANLIRRDLLSYNIHHEPSSIQSMDSLNQEIDSYAFSIIRSDRDSIIEKVQVAPVEGTNRRYKKWVFSHDGVLLRIDEGIYNMSTSTPYRVSIFVNGRKRKVINYNQEGQRTSFYMINYE